MSEILMSSAKALVEQSRSLLVLSGAGMSAESGVPTFRDAQTGLWAKFRAEDLATPEAFERDPGLVWSWYQQRRRDLNIVQPNPGHFAVASFGIRHPHCTVVTQNVDDLHERAGSNGVVHLHGELSASHCFSCGATGDQSGQSTESEYPPHCTECSGLMRPSVVWFGETLPAMAWSEAEAAAQDCDLVICAGTSGMVYPAAHLPSIAAEAGARVIQVNIDATALDAIADINLRGPSGVILPELLAEQVGPSAI